MGGVANATPGVPGERRITRRTFLMGLAGAGLATGYPVLVERVMVQVNHYDIPIVGLAPPFDGFRLVHLSDLHYAEFTSASWLGRVLDRAQEEAGDLIVLTGDYVHARKTREQLDTIWPELTRIDAPFGVRMVLGNHDHWADSDHALGLLEASGRSLRNRAEVLRKDGAELVLAGTGDLWEDEVRIDETLAGQDPASPRIVLAHNPDTADLPHRERVDLFVCGHTHGGQVRLPVLGAPILAVANKAYDQGLRWSARSRLFINRGIGWAGLPIRQNCPPEIAVLHLRAA